MQYQSRPFGPPPSKPPPSSPAPDSILPCPSGSSRPRSEVASSLPQRAPGPTVGSTAAATAALTDATAAPPPTVAPGRGAAPIAIESVAAPAVSVAYSTLLRQLAQQHTFELQAAVQQLSEENRRLASQLEAALGKHPQTTPRQDITLQTGESPAAKTGIVQPADIPICVVPSLIDQKASAKDTMELPGAVADTAEAAAKCSASKMQRTGAETKSRNNAPRSMFPPNNREEGAEHAGFMRVTMAADLENEISNLDAKNRQKMKLRLKGVLHLDKHKTKDQYVGIYQLSHALERKRLVLSDEGVRCVLKELHTMSAGLGKPTKALNEDGSMHFDDFVDMIMIPGLKSWVQDAALAEHVGKVQGALLAKSVDEVICQVTRTKTRLDDHGNSILESRSSEHLNLVDIQGKEERERRRARYLNIINNVAFMTIVASILKFGLQMDIQLDENDWYWYILEAVFAFIFVLEFVFKNLLQGPYEYFCGEERYWNWLDTFITAFALCDSAVQLIAWGENDQALPGAKLTMMVRMIRLSRVARLVKALRAPFLRDLGSMLVGLFVGAPWLIWVMLLLGAVTYMLALGFRHAVGPVTVGYGKEEPRLGRCGSGDNINDQYKDAAGYSDTDECPIHQLLGEEFFHSVPVSFFTVFRCLIGDCSTAGGQSLVVHLAKGYGWRFYLMYFVGMTTVIFGVFNIITAMIIDGTFSGLQAYHQRERRSRLYEERYVREHLQSLVTRMYAILGHEVTESAATAPGFSPGGSMIGLNKENLMGMVKRRCEEGELDDSIFEESVQLTDDDFCHCMQDPIVKCQLEALDIDCTGIEGLFDMIDTDGTGVVSIPEIVDVVIKMRGELSKGDIMANWFTLRSLHDRFNKFQLVLLANQQQAQEAMDKLMEAQDRILNK